MRLTCLLIKLPAPAQVPFLWLRLVADPSKAEEVQSVAEDHQIYAPQKYKGVFPSPAPKFEGGGDGADMYRARSPRRLVSASRR